MIIVKQKAYDLLLENNIDRPLQFSDLEKICSKNDWSLLPYKGHERLIHKIGMDKMMDYDGFTYRAKQGTDTITIIFFRDTLGQARRVHVVAHEIGHLVLNHMYQTSASFSLVDVPHEQEAEEFAFEIELPSCVSKRAHFNTPSKFRMHGDWIPSSIAYHISDNSDPYSSVPENEADILSLYSKFINRCIKKKRMRLFITSLSLFVIASLGLYMFLTPKLQSQSATSTVQQKAQPYNIDYGSMTVDVWPMSSSGWEMITAETPDESLGEYADFKNLLDNERLVYYVNIDLAKSKQGEYIAGYFIDQRTNGTNLDFSKLDDRKIINIVENYADGFYFYKSISDLGITWAFAESQIGDNSWRQMLAMTYVNDICISYMYSCDTQLYSAERAENALIDVITGTSIAFD